MGGSKMKSQVEISIILCSNKLDNFENFINNIEATVKHPNIIEILVACDIEDKDFLSFCNNNNFKIKVKCFNIYEGDLYNQHKMMSSLLSYVHKDSYYVLAMSDDMRFDTKEWDEKILQYKHLFPDDIFRLRLGWRKHFKYSDYWQCVSMPENIDVCTKKWRNLVGEIPCFSIDSYNQNVMFYLENIDKFNNNFRATRDIAVENIKMQWHDAASVDDRIILKKMLKAWNISTSYKTQLIASNTANKIYKEIRSYSEELDENFKAPKPSFLKIFFLNIYRKIFYLEYGGGGFTKKISGKKLFSLRWLRYIYFNIRI